VGVSLEPVDALRAEIGALERAYSPGHHGVWAARRRAELMDAALADLFERAGAPDGTAVAAVGGYGRRLLLPRSDIDLLVLHDGSDAEAVARLADALLYPLWNAGFEVGHAVRSPEESEEAAGRLDVGASMLDIRLVAGDEALVADVAARIRAWARRDPQAFAASLRDDAARRAERSGSAAQLLEPDLKEGSGGWRDLHSIWLLEAAVGIRLEEAGLLSGRESEALAAAGEFLTRVRSALHLETGKRSDRLVLDHQPAIAEVMGFADEPRLIAIDGLMRAVFEHTRDVEFLFRAVIARFREGGAPPVAPPTTPAAVLDALAAEAEAGREPSAALLDAIDDLDMPDAVEWDDATRAAFSRLLRAGDRGAASFEVLDRLGILAAFVPEWADVRCRPQRDPYHRLTVDAHLTSSLRSMGRLLAGAGADDDAVQVEAVRQVTDGVETRDAVLLGALLHDIGKNGESGHVRVGTRVVASILDRMGVPEPMRDLVRFMVERHLLLPDTATRRDLSDENLVLDVAAVVGSPERLASLYLLAKADAEATGPAAWTPWRQTLIRELVAKVEHVLERGEMGTEIAEQLMGRIGRIRTLLADEPDAELDRFIRRMPRAYLLAVEPARIARHYATIAPPMGVNDVRAVHFDGTRSGTYEVLVVARDRAGLLSWIAGALALAGMSILTAHVFTTDDGVATDLFEVEGVWEAEVPERRWREFRGMLRRAVDGSISLERRVDEKRRWYPPPRVPTPVTIAVDNDASDFSTVIEVGAPDRLGLLYDITRTFAELGLDVHLAKVATYEGRVVDSFYVRDALGPKLAGDLGALDRALRIRLEA
jgi:[protein-PII] uridylyltransferase